MPYAVTHILVPIIIVSIIRAYFVDKNKFPLHYVLIAGIAGLLPDIDVPIWWILQNFGYTLLEVHRTFSHTLFVPIIFLLLAFITTKTHNHFLAKHKLKLNIIFYMIALGTLIHLLLDSILMGYIMPLYPFNTKLVGLNLIPVTTLGMSIIAGIDAILLVLWLIHEELRHKISSFI
ncbi:MAG: metal-dependent hydrolase [Nanoarchaeota archaeon]|nr:metal-dependent hydrolase [Nanoarchaeota archaeon]